MNDSTDEFFRIPIGNLPDPPLPLADARDRVKAAFVELFTAVRLLEQSAWRFGWDRGHEWTMDQLKKFAEKTATETVAKVSNIATQPPLPMDGMSIGEPVRKLHVRPAADVVYDAIKDKPGLTGIELVRHLEKIGTPLNERTVRTALFRLKVDKIMAVKNRWYTVEAAQSLPLAEVMS